MKDFECKEKPAGKKFFRIKNKDSLSESKPILTGSFNSRRQAASRWSFKLPSTNLTTAVNIRMAILFTNFKIVRQNPRVLVLSEKDFTESLKEITDVVGDPTYLRIRPTEDTMKAIISQQNFDLIMVDKDSNNMEEFLNSDTTIAKTYQVVGY